LPGTIIIGAVDREVARVDDEVGAHSFDPAGNRLPIVVEVRLGRAEMGVADLDDLHGERGLWGWFEAPREKQMAPLSAAWAPSLEGSDVSLVTGFLSCFSVPP
jgi:hypothetical protein